MMKNIITIHGENDNIENNDETQRTMAKGDKE